MTAYYNEIDPFAAAWLRVLIAEGHIAPGIVDERSIEDVRPDELTEFTQCHFFAGIGVWSYALRQAGWPDDRPVWTGSCPCQPFSSAGKGGGFDDERHLWPSFAWLIQQCRPATILGEQVASKATWPWFDLVQSDVEALGYAFGCVPFPSAGVGAPHIRDRAYWVGHTDEPGSQAHPGHGGAEGRERPGGSATSTGVSGGLGDPDDSGRQSQPTDIRIDGEGMESSRGQPVARVKTSGDVSIGLADSDSEQHHGGRGIRAARGIEYTDGSAAGGLAHTQLPQRRQEHSPRPRVEGVNAIQPEGQENPTGYPGGSEDGRLAKPNSSGLQQGSKTAEAVGYGNTAEPDGGNSRPGPTNGLWRNADWLHCRDGKWRPVEPGTFPVVNGATNRVGRLRGYGNAINAEAARVWIETVIDCLYKP